MRAFVGGVDRLDELNQRFKKLATSQTEQSVEEARRLLGTIEMAAQEIKERGPSQEEALANAARELLLQCGLDDTLEIIQSEHRTTLSPKQLVHLVGNHSYIAALRKEANDYRSNAISFEQISELWNDFGRPPLGDAAWTPRTVASLIE
jgi:hypothetical protein